LNYSFVDSAGIVTTYACTGTSTSMRTENKRYRLSLLLVHSPFVRRVYLCTWHSTASYSTVRTVLYILECRTVPHALRTVLARNKTSFFWCSESSNATIFVGKIMSVMSDEGCRLESGVHTCTCELYLYLYCNDFACPVVRRCRTDTERAKNVSKDLVCMAVQWTSSHACT
jgi:hypothetical protein